jgi:hypothetical protein
VNLVGIIYQKDKRMLIEERWRGLKSVTVDGTGCLGVRHKAIILEEEEEETEEEGLIEYCTCFDHILVLHSATSID